MLAKRANLSREAFPVGLTKVVSIGDYLKSCPDRVLLSEMIGRRVPLPKEIPSLHLLGRMSGPELQQSLGISEKQAHFLMSAFEVGKRFFSEPLERSIAITSPEMVFRFAKGSLGLEQVEGYYLLTMDTKLHPIDCHLINKGDVNSGFCSPREVVRTALKDNAAAIITFHNHPSGDTTPSPEDRNLTKSVSSAAKAVDIQFLDSLVVGKTSFSSMRDLIVQKTSGLTQNSSAAEHCSGYSSCDDDQEQDESPSISPH
ncbi:JAB domain-containing protein [Leptospirillum ferriphilum]|uniref:JAB domain-containing protein n=1 Tax=Leptospirillum ferriphilum TaxID=178606 RepID=UPI0006B143F4|nr:JAB domain-containing protein [Leptospirillum ferriphilum]